MRTFVILAFIAETRLTLLMIDAHRHDAVLTVHDLQYASDTVTRRWTYSLVIATVKLVGAVHAFRIPVGPVQFLLEHGEGERVFENTALL